MLGLIRLSSSWTAARPTNPFLVTSKKWEWRDEISLKSGTSYEGGDGARARCVLLFGLDEASTDDNIIGSITADDLLRHLVDDYTVAIYSHATIR